jgi:hypothetical protein
MWALLTFYQTLRRAICDAVETLPGTDPDRASFTVALTTAINQIVNAANITDTAPVSLRTRRGDSSSRASPLSAGVNGRGYLVGWNCDSFGISVRWLTRAI